LPSLESNGTGAPWFSWWRRFFYIILSQCQIRGLLQFKVVISTSIFYQVSFLAKS
jgi:hypothetical protein